MADEKKKINILGITSYFGMTMAVLYFGFLGYLQITETELCLLDKFLNCYTLCLVVAAIFMLIRFLVVFKKGGKKLNYRLVLMLLATLIICVCGGNSLIQDLKITEVSEFIMLDDMSQVAVCEVETGEESHRIDVYRVTDFFAKKIGYIDEQMFSEKCIDSGRYTYYFDEYQTKIFIACEYGTLSDGDRVYYSSNEETVVYSFDLDT